MNRLTLLCGVSGILGLLIGASLFSTDPGGSSNNAFAVQPAPVGVASRPTEQPAGGATATEMTDEEREIGKLQLQAVTPEDWAVAQVSGEVRKPQIGAGFGRASCMVRRR